MVWTSLYDLATDRLVTLAKGTSGDNELLVTVTVTAQ